MSNQLLPCPFCGNDEPTHDEGDQSAWVQCTNLECGMCGPIASGPSLAAAAWNRRATQPAVDDLKRLSVTNILLNVAPGPDGMGHEVYAESVEQVERRLCDLGDQVEHLSDSLALTSAALAKTAAPPAAAHGDEALESAQNDLARTMAWVEKFKGMFGAIADGSAFYLSTAAEGRRRCQGILVRYEQDQAAMRAQGDGDSRHE